jgi:hypothetical protein
MLGRFRVLDREIRVVIVGRPQRSECGGGG